MRGAAPGRHRGHLPLPHCAGAHPPASAHPVAVQGPVESEKWWQQDGVFDQLHRILLAELNAAGRLDWSRACVDGSHIRAKKRGRQHWSVAGRRRKTGSKHHLICDGRGTPLKVITTAANVNDVTQTPALIDGIPPVAGRPGRPLRRPEALLGDKGYDSNPNRDQLRKHRILPVISRKGAPHIKSTGQLRYVVEQTFALLHQSKRLAVRCKRRPKSTTPSSPSPAASSAGGASTSPTHDRVTSSKGRTLRTLNTRHRAE
ncbi:hypothetical protein Sxan_04170 [Streptomyces xanthophaeus]|uniref:Transposase IS4-like domain-containing protein n=1 Tax=Streptomyces xanthophaeus TaxID=67385 RepID=A0A919GRP7_9ACTN|nr:hypothetical protein Sxan_04170 [Streptomyces xanthophaeus]